MSDVDGEIARLRDLVANARSMPMSASAVINRQEVLDAIARLQDAVAASSSESRAVLAERDGVLAEGEQIAIETVRQAELKRDELVSDSEVFRVATREADAVREAAKLETEQLRQETDAYIEQRLANFEHSLGRLLTEVRRGIDNLTGKGSAGDVEPGSDDVLLADPDAG